MYQAWGAGRSVVSVEDKKDVRDTLNLTDLLKCLILLVA